MAITIVQERKKQRYLILALAMIIFAILAVVWWGFSRRQGSVSVPSVPEVVYALPKTEIDWQMLEDLRAESLQPFEGISAFEGQFGRENPFVSY